VNLHHNNFIIKRYLSNDANQQSNSWLSKENQTIPNYITFARIFASPGLTYALMNDLKVWALGGCVVFAFSDWLDGYIAKNYNQKSTLGAYLDPLADKVMIGSLSLGLMYQGLLPTQLVGLIVGRDIFLLTMSFIIRGIDKPPDAPFFETTKSSTFEVVPSDISKVSLPVSSLDLISAYSHHV
jgi:cardiolipin synthase